MRFLQQLLFRDRISIKRAPAIRRAARLILKTQSVSSDPVLKALWVTIRTEYFPDRPDLDNYVVRWSRRRQKRTLASCNMRRRLVSVAREMGHESCRDWLSPLLYHEMCHAVLGADLPKRRGRRPWHGHEFRALEARHPRIRELDHWIRSGGWTSAVRSARATEAHRRRKR